MALASQLHPGYRYRVWTGIYEDEVVTIVDNTIIRKEDDFVNQRKIKVLLDGGIEYMLPRTMEDEACGVDLTLLPHPEVLQAEVLRVARLLNSMENSHAQAH